MILPIDKPSGMTSHDVVNRVRRIYNEKRVGHAGTLDPFATGVLIIMVGRDSTKRSAELMGQDKEYVATLRLGYESDSHDRDGEIREYIHPTSQGSHTPSALHPPLSRGELFVPSLETIQDTVTKYIGDIAQIPPMHSAIKINGQKLYKLAHQGKSIERSPREVHIDNICIESYEYPFLTIRVNCGSGTYVRSLARDIGRDLKTGAYLQELRRTKSGEYAESDLVTLEELAEKQQAE